VETPTDELGRRISEAGWHTRMSSRLAGKGVCACHLSGFQHPASAVAPSGHRGGNGQANTASGRGRYGSRTRRRWRALYLSAAKPMSDFRFPPATGALRCLSDFIEGSIDDEADDELISEKEKAAWALSRLPDPLKSGSVLVSVGQWRPGASDGVTNRWAELELYPSLIELRSGGHVYDPAAGGDSFSNIVYQWEYGGDEQGSVTDFIDLFNELSGGELQVRAEGFEIEIDPKIQELADYWPDNMDIPPGILSDNNPVDWKYELIRAQLDAPLLEQSLVRGFYEIKNSRDKIVRRIVFEKWIAFGLFSISMLCYVILDERFQFIAYLGFPFSILLLWAVGVAGAESRGLFNAIDVLERRMQNNAIRVQWPFDGGDPEILTPSKRYERKKKQRSSA